jgi:hypothetical protein
MAGRVRPTGYPGVALLNSMEGPLKRWGRRQYRREEEPVRPRPKLGLPRGVAMSGSAPVTRNG